MSTTTLLVLLYCLVQVVLLPLGSIRTAVRIKKLNQQHVPVTTADPTKRLRQGLTLPIAILALAAMYSQDVDVEFFRFPKLNPWTVGATVAAIGGSLLLVGLSAWVRTKRELETAFFWNLVPANRLQAVLLLLTIPVTSFSAEYAYRGIGWALVGYLTGDFISSVVICSASYALLYSIYGWKQVGLMFVFAVMMHALVVMTESLIPAILVHPCFLVFATFVVVRAYHRRHGMVQVRAE